MSDEAGGHPLGLVDRLGVHRWPVVAFAACSAVLLLGALIGAVTSDDDGAPPARQVDPTVGAPIVLGGPPPDDVVRFGAVGLEHLDPAFVLPSDQSGMVAVDLLFDGLTSWDPQTQAPVPALAESWESASFATEWTFHLRAGATFSDGTPVTARDAERSLERIARLGNISLAGVRLDVVAGYREVSEGLTEDLTGVSALDDRTLRIVTLEPYAAMPELLSSPLYAVVPAGVVDADPVAFDGNPVGSGPYRFAGRDGAVLRLEAVDGSEVPVRRAELIAYPTAEEAYAAFEAGELDWSVVPAGLLDEARAEHGERAVVPFVVELLYGFNLRHPSFGDVRFRSAVAKAIDRGALLDSPLEAATALDGVVPSGVPGAVADACGVLCSYDPDTARALVAQVHPNGQVPAIELDVYDDPLELAVADAVAEDLRAIGVPVNVVVEPFEEYQGFIVGGGQQLFTFGWVGVAIEPDVFVSPLFLSDSPDNVTGFADPVVDLAIKTARAEPDAGARRALYADIDRQVMRGVPIVPLASYLTAAVVGERLEGYVPRTDGTFVVEAMSVR